MRAMTWFDWETFSVWSQPWGRAISGELKGTRLKQLPSELTTWRTWRAEHPETLVMINDYRPNARLQVFDSNFVIGVTLGEDAKAFPYPSVAERGAVNDSVGPNPIVVAVDAESKAMHAYLRIVADSTLTFDLRDGQLVDRETNTVWDLARGLGLEGELKGELLVEVPYISSFGPEWMSFYPHSEIYQP